MEPLASYPRVRDAAEFLGGLANALRNRGRGGKVKEFRHPVNNYRRYGRADLADVPRQACGPARPVWGGKRTEPAAGATRRGGP